MLPVPPVIAWTLAAVGAVAISKAVAKQWRRVNAEFDARSRAADPVSREHLPKLRRDPKTGEYRPE